MSSEGRFSAGRKPRVVMVSANAYPVMGGVETHVNEVAPRVAAAGFDVTILTTDRSGNLPRRDILGGVPTLRSVPAKRVGAWPAGRDWYFAPGILRDVALGDWDLVHCQGYHTFVPVLAMLGAITTRKPFVITFHSGGHDSAMRNRTRTLQHSVLRPLLLRAKRLIAVSDWEASQFASRLDIAKPRFTIIPNGAELPAPDATAVGPGDRERPLILSVGRLERYKGHQRVIAAMPELVNFVPGARLRIAGQGPYESELRRQADRSGVGEHIEIEAVDPSDRAGMAALMSGAALVVLMSEWESQGIAVLEALALRRHVLVAETTALQEFVDQGVAAGIPLHADPVALARKMFEELSGPDRPPARLPTWDGSAAQIVELYRRVLDAR